MRYNHITAVKYWNRYVKYSGLLMVYMAARPRLATSRILGGGMEAAVSNGVMSCLETEFWPISREVWHHIQVFPGSDLMPSAQWLFFKNVSPVTPWTWNRKKKGGSAIFISLPALHPVLSSPVNSYCLPITRANFVQLSSLPCLKKKPLGLK